MIETIHVINLSPHQQVDNYHSPELQQWVRRHREERALSVVEQSKKYRFAVRFWPGIVGENDVFRSVNVMRAFKQIVQYAKEERLPTVTIMEDDGVFTSDNAWKYYNDFLPDDFDLYSGGIYAGQINGSRIINGFSGNTLITLHERFYDFFLSADEDPLSTHMAHLDRFLGQYCDVKKYYVCWPFVIRQMGFYSDNQRRRLTNEYSMYEQSWEYLQD